MRYFYHGSKGWYCRKCVRFLSGEEVDYSIKEVDSDYQLSFELTNRQKEISNQLCSLVNAGHSVLLEAVCGAGKTELVYQTIADSLAKGKKVGFAIPRRQVVLELAERLQSVFTKLKVIALCQGHTKEVNGDLIVCTTHQLYRYHQYFDVLIIDEPDAFPFKGNEVLQGIAQRAIVGSKIYLTATPDESLMKQVSSGKLKYLYLPKRPSNQPMVVPEVFYGGKIVCFLYGAYRIFKMLKRRKQVILFVPTIKTGRRMFFFIGKITNSCYIDSKIENRDEIIKDFKDKKYDLILSTTVLERGVTIKGVQMVVWDSSNGVFDEASLVQMAGRVGRDVKDPTGECLFLAMKKVSSIDRCIRRIVKANND